jgi:hypothetical protein
MKAIDSRLSKLENRLGLARSGPRYLLVVMEAGRELGRTSRALMMPGFSPPVVSGSSI